MPDLFAGNMFGFTVKLIHNVVNVYIFSTPINGTINLPILANLKQKRAALSILSRPINNIFKICRLNLKKIWKEICSFYTQKATQLIKSYLSQ